MQKRLDITAELLYKEKAGNKLVIAKLYHVNGHLLLAFLGGSDTIMTVVHIILSKREESDMIKMFGTNTNAIWKGHYLKALKEYNEEMAVLERIAGGGVNRKGNGFPK